MSMASQFFDMMSSSHNFDIAFFLLLSLVIKFKQLLNSCQIQNQHPLIPLYMAFYLKQRTLKAQDQINPKNYFRHEM